MAKISVISITSREMYIPEIIECLKNQSFQDFEYILIDDLKEQHENFKEIVEEKFPFIHMTPFKVVPYYAASAAFNDGLTRCSGELVFFTADYILPHYDCLRRHWELHEKYPKAFLSGRCLEVDFLPSELKTRTGSFQGADYRLGLFTQNYFGWSMIEENLFASKKEGAQNWWAGRNDSAPMEAILECNGFDESMDGHHGYQDEDLAQRMQILGYNYLIDTKSNCLFFPHQRSTKMSLRSESDQQAFKDKVIPERIKNGIYRVNEHRNLRQEREEWLKSRQLV